VSERAAASEETLFPAVHPRRADRLYERGRILIRLARIDEARPLLERAIGIWTKLGDSERDYVVDALIDLARLERAAGRQPQARVAAQRAADLARPGHNDSGLASALEQLGALDVASGAFASARERFEHALALEESTYGKDAVDLDVALVGLGQSRRGAGDVTGATKTFERALSVLAKVPDGGPAGQSRATAALELAYLLWSDPASRPRALKLAQLAERSFRAGGPLSATDHQRATRWLASHAAL
jgi:tetratricopeptide (TPR) repeat protein